MRGLRALAKQRHLVDRAMLVHAPGGIARAHHQRVDDGDGCRVEPLDQAFQGKFIHQEADGAAVHAVDRLAGFHEFVQGLQHQAVSAERHDDVGGLRLDIAVTGLQPLIGLARLRRRTGDEGNVLETLGRFTFIRKPSDL